jgi:hypothetical protein
VLRMRAHFASAILFSCCPTRVKLQASFSYSPRNGRRQPPSGNRCGGVIASKNYSFLLSQVFELEFNLFWPFFYPALRHNSNTFNGGIGIKLPCRRESGNCSPDLAKTQPRSIRNDSDLSDPALNPHSAISRFNCSSHTLSDYNGIQALHNDKIAEVPVKALSFQLLV